MNVKNYLTLSRAARQLPGRPAAGTLWRWCRRGLTSRDGRRVYLQHIRIGARIYTRLDWVEEFGNQLAEADLRSQQVAHNNRLCVPSHLEAEEILAKEGL